MEEACSCVRRPLAGALWRFLRDGNAPPHHLLHDLFGVHRHRHPTGGIRARLCEPPVDGCVDGRRGRDAARVSAAAPPGGGARLPEPQRLHHRPVPLPPLQTAVCGSRLRADADLPVRADDLVCRLPARPDAGRCPQMGLHAGLLRCHPGVGGVGGHAERRPLGRGPERRDDRLLPPRAPRPGGALRVRAHLRPGRLPGALARDAQHDRQGRHPRGMCDGGHRPGWLRAVRLHCGRAPRVLRLPSSRVRLRHGLLPPERARIAAWAAEGAARLHSRQ
mmetsp:Transcript_98150/g.293223  ORF Transcript_98150/g.293223 Transcript_98150/m.293223 type:complete len:277 (-) Transcript_98150:230-1060(-)